MGKIFPDLIKILQRLYIRLLGYYFNKNTGKFFKMLLRSRKDLAKNLTKKYSNILQRSYTRSAIILLLQE